MILMSKMVGDDDNGMQLLSCETTRDGKEQMVSSSEGNKMLVMMKNGGDGTENQGKEGRESDFRGGKGGTFT